MKFKGHKLNNLSSMKPGNMYVFVEERLQGTEQKAWAFTYIEKEQVDERLCYRGQLIANNEIPIILSPEDEHYMKEGTSFLYTLEEL